jgi:hypothetical protein
VRAEATQLVADGDAAFKADLFDAALAKYDRAIGARPPVCLPVLHRNASRS